ncbi:MAG TPA: hypothetical protein VN605_08345 [Thermoanaerobaculia bacterium]|nr:hypothetical protein [Thermoanaerobaculia bacterium]
MQQLYDPLIERDLAAIPDAVRRFREEHSSDELFLAIARFALLAYAPSQHAKHALLACLAVHDLREELGARFDEAVTELAIYAAGSRQPWSEPPILDPPPVDDAQPGQLAELLAAIEAGDRHRAERWLAKRIDDPSLPHDYFAAAADDLEDLGHKVIVAAAAWRLVPILGERGKYTTLRVGIWEMTAYRGPRHERASSPAAVRELLPRTIGQAIAARGSIESMHAVFLQEALLTMGELLSDPPLVPQSAPMVSLAEVPIYRYARDYAQCLKAHAVAKRLRSRFPDLPLEAFVAAAHENLEQTPSFEDWSFA